MESAMGGTQPILKEDNFPLDSLWQSNENPYVEMMIWGAEVSHERIFVSAWWHFRQGRNFEKL